MDRVNQPERKTKKWSPVFIAVPQQGYSGVRLKFEYKTLTVLLAVSLDFQALYPTMQINYFSDGHNI